MRGNFSDITFPQRAAISKQSQRCERAQKILSNAAMKLNMFPNCTLYYYQCALYQVAHWCCCIQMLA